MSRKMLLVQIGAPILSVLFSLWTGIKFMMDWIGRSTVADDSAHALTLVERGAHWLFATPWWVPGLLATVLTAVTVLASGLAQPATGTGKATSRLQSGTA